MAYQEVAQGGPLELWGGLQQYNSDFDEGGRGLLEINTLIPVSPNIVKSALDIAGVPDTKVTADGKTLRIFFKKTAWWLPIIIIALAGLAVIVLLWTLFKEVGPDGTKLLLVAAIAGIAVAGVYMIRR